MNTTDRLETRRTRNSTSLPLFIQSDSCENEFNGRRDKIVASIGKCVNRDFSSSFTEYCYRSISHIACIIGEAVGETAEREVEFRCNWEGSDGRESLKTIKMKEINWRTKKKKTNRRWSIEFPRSISGEASRAVPSLREPHSGKERVNSTEPTRRMCAGALVEINRIRAILRAVCTKGELGAVRTQERSVHAEPRGRVASRSIERSRDATLL